MNVVIISKGQDPSPIIMHLDAASNVTVSFDGLFHHSLPCIYCTSLPAHPEGFYAGANRDNGLMASYKKFGRTGHVLFLDGDRTPKGFNSKDIIECMSRLSVDALLFTCECGDTRSIATTSEYEGPVDTGSLLSEFYSCGFVLTDNAIEKVRKVNGGRLFHPIFDGTWGEEDKYLGIQLDALGLRTGFTHAVRLGGDRPGNDQDHPEFVQSLQKRVDLMAKNGYAFRHWNAHTYMDKHGDFKYSIAPIATPRT